LRSLLIFLAAGPNALSSALWASLIFLTAATFAAFRLAVPVFFPFDWSSVFIKETFLSLRFIYVSKVIVQKRPN
jgi:drug/metabolite transporter (DMT)-like permease